MARPAVPALLLLLLATAAPLATAQVMHPAALDVLLQPDSTEAILPLETRNVTATIQRTCTSPGSLPASQGQLDVYVPYGLVVYGPNSFVMPEQTCPLQTQTQVVLQFQVVADLNTTAGPYAGIAQVHVDGAPPFGSPQDAQSTFGVTVRRPAEAPVVQEAEPAREAPGLPAAALLPALGALAGLFGRRRL